MLGGRLGLVTGGGSGIGRAVCAALAMDGARVVIADVNKQMALNTLKTLPNENEHQAIEVDVGDSKSVKRLFSEIRRLYSSAPSLVINSAGCLSHSFLLNTEESAFDEMVRVNLKGTFLITQAAAKEMVEDKLKECSIVNISTVLGTTGFRKMSCYVAAKSGVIGFTKSAALELAQFGIRCNIVLPGITHTPLLSPLDEETIQALVKRSALQREGTPEDIASVCLFLASPKSSYITGAAIEVAGGVNA
ncbi:estradiol 17-beta-dehydrogenase 8-like [Ornithodoros turicata]|uniref:(3R)-3-hydroxyacyl-CoA dehydrogenase n=1 Tax=Ornithodoros turicata TaxID=34597 RepID=A0A2R5LEK5_9ACAR